MVCQPEHGRPENVPPISAARIENYTKIHNPNRNSLLSPVLLQAIITMVSAEYVKSIFAALANGDAPTFFNNVADNVSWRVTGTDNPLSGQYNSKSEFVSKTFQRLGALMQGRMRLEVVNVLVDGDTAAVELKADATAKNGSEFANEYCWVCRFENNKIVQVRAYLDSALVKRTIEENEK